MTAKPLFWKNWKKFEKLKPSFLNSKLDFQETKLWFSSCKLLSILWLTFQLLNSNLKPSKYNFLSKKWYFEGFLNLQKYGCIHLCQLNTLVENFISCLFSIIRFNELWIYFAIAWSIIFFTVIVLLNKYFKRTLRNCIFKL